MNDSEFLLRLKNEKLHDRVNELEQLSIEYNKKIDRFFNLLERSIYMLQRAKNFMIHIDKFDPELMDEIAKELGDET